jgi:hypothetical protein
METLGKPVLPGLTRLDVGRVNAAPVAETAQRQRHELGTIVHAKRSGPATLNH